MWVDGVPIGDSFVSGTTIAIRVIIILMHLEIIAKKQFAINYLFAPLRRKSSYLALLVIIVTTSIGIYIQFIANIMAAFVSNEMRWYCVGHLLCGCQRRRRTICYFHNSYDIGGVLKKVSRGTEKLTNDIAIVIDL